MHVLLNLTDSRKTMKKTYCSCGYTAQLFLPSIFKGGGLGRVTSGFERRFVLASTRNGGGGGGETACPLPMPTASSSAHRPSD